MLFYTGVLLNLDGVVDSQGDIIDENTAIELPSQEVKVTLDFHEGPEFLLGHARLFFAPKELRYEILLMNDRLPKFSLETLIPAAGGVVFKREGNNITHLLVDRIGLTTRRNSDVRIQPLKDQT